jgi:hypothetical protein
MSTDRSGTPDPTIRNTFLDPRHQAQFREEGYVILDLLQPSDVRRLLQAYEPFRELHEDGFTATVLLQDGETRTRIHHEASEVFEARLLPVLDEHRIVVASYAIKQAACEDARVGLHQDLTFVDECSRIGVSLWCPLVEVTEENGWLGVVPGSHVLNPYFREPCSLPYPELFRLIEQSYLRYLKMAPGQALLMDNRLFHASPGNRTDRSRVVAAGIAVPRESPLLYCHRALQAGAAMLEVWEVPAEFYLRHLIGQRPKEGRHIATMPRRVAELTEERLRECCGPATPPQRR